MAKLQHILCGFLLACVSSVALAADPATKPSALPPDGPPTVKWQNILKQSKAWYASADAKRVAENVLLWQQACGGWNKNIEMAKVLSEEKKAVILAEKSRNDATLDNDATTTQISFLTKMFAVNNDPRYRDAAVAGVAYVLRAQYPDNGGWPQFYPLRGGYHDHITYNDNAMLHAMLLLRSISRKEDDFEYLPQETIDQATGGLDRAIACVLKTQIVVNGKKTAWCAQHDEHTLKPANARSYELASISGSESVGLIKFLMQIEKPSAEVIDAVESAVAWFDAVKITGKELKESPDGNRTLVDNPNGPVLWARFYEIGTNRPIYCNRDGVIHYEFSDLTPDRRNGYAWIRPWGTDLLAKSYPAWKARISATTH